ncbi:uncharacterized protein LOC134303338 [Trichomycterus rosablanca]|uniref:uncharacterized protein LOC134303338 n=1 Tax=Trichomycterus rosablanca TaxID=2290929 RepID=UPI002F3587EF
MVLQKFVFLVVGGSILMTVAIVIVFIIINSCIRKTAAKYNAKSKSKSNLYNTSSSEKNITLFSYCDQDTKPPPLPSRHQFDTESNHSYEDMNPVVNTITVSQKQTSPLRQPIISRQPETHINIGDNQNFSNNYKEVEKTNQYVDSSSYEASPTPPDYLDLDQSKDVEDESDLDYDDAAPADTVSLEYEDAVPVETISLDYDDVGPPDTVSEDYDEVG